MEFLKAEEGFKSKAYRCSQGALTIGYGHKLLKTDNIKSITKQQAEQLLISDFEKAIARIYETFSGIEDKQLFSYAVLSFQTGHAGFLKFKNFIKADCKIKKEEELKNSKLYKQCKNRVNRYIKDILN